MARRMVRTAAVVVCGVGVAAATAVGLGVVELGAAAETPVAAAPAGPTVAVTLETLSEVSTVDGELGFGPATPIISKASGTITWLPAPGTVLERGDTLLRADDRPVVVLFGALPMYRDLALDLEGPDVAQLEANLVALGFTGFTEDETFTDKTAAAVKAWQQQLAVEETGTVTVADVVYAAGPLRVDASVAAVGAEATGEVLSVSGTTKVVTTDVSPSEATWAVPQTAVEVTLPDGVAVPGTVATVGAEATAGGVESDGGAAVGGTTATVPVTITVEDQAALGTLDRAPVVISYTVSERVDVLTVPVTALLALAEGGYGVEVVTDGDRRVVAVDTGLVADGRVEVRGESLAAGQQVGIPG